MAWNKTIDGNYIILTSDTIIVNDNGGGDAEYVAHSPVIDTKLYPGWEGVKFPCTVAVSVVSGGAAGILDAFLQTSNGSATTGDVYGAASETPLWADATTAQDLGALASLNTTVSSSGLIDASDVKAPYARVSLKVAGTTDIGDDLGRLTIAIAIPKGLGGGDVESISGVGADPS